MLQPCVIAAPMLCVVILATNMMRITIQQQTETMVMIDTIK